MVSLGKCNLTNDCCLGIQDVIALVRPASIHKPAIQRLGDKGIQIRKCDLKAPEEHLIEALAEIDVVISCVGPAEQQDQIPLAKAAKKAGVKRFIPCGFITVAPPGGVMWLRDEVRSENQTPWRKVGEEERRGGLWCNIVPEADSFRPIYRKKLSTTKSANSGSHTPLSMWAGGTSFPTLASPPVVLIML